MEDVPCEVTEDSSLPVLRDLLSALVSLNSLINRLPRDSKVRYLAETARNELSDVVRML